MSSKRIDCGNERMHMMMLGRDILGLMFHRTFPPQEGSFPQEPKERELSGKEQGLYDGIVDFLTREFKAGPRELPQAPPPPPVSDSRPG